MRVKANSRNRQIGPWGTAARLLVGSAALVAVRLNGLDLGDVVVGLVGIPVVVMLVVLSRGRHAPPIRAHAAYWHCINIGFGVLLVNINLAGSLLFYGVSMLFAAWRGMGACELLTLSNLVLRRDDQLACPVFLPVDAAEAKATGRELYCA